VSTDGARRLSVRDREMTYLCSREYSRAEIVYRKALRRIGSVFDEDAGRGDTDELGPDDWKLADLELLARAPAPAPVLEAIAVVLLVFCPNSDAAVVVDRGRTRGYSCPMAVRGFSCFSVRGRAGRVLFCSIASRLGVFSS